MVMLMSAFDEAWDIAKMARHKVGPVEIWDYNEPVLSANRVEDHEKFNEMGIPLMQDKGPEPEWHRKWRTGTRWEGDEPPKSEEERSPETWDERYRYQKNYIPMGGSPWFGDMAAKVLMTPTQYLSLNVPTKFKYADRDRPDKILESPFDFFDREEDFSGVGRMAQSIKEGYPIFIPNINIRRPDASDERNIDFRVTGHEGRHRMAAIHDLLGDVPVPVQISSDEFGGQNELGQRTIGGSARPSSKMQEALLGAVLGGRENRDARFTIRELFDEMYD
jgi:hypothetical protein